MICPSTTRKTQPKAGTSTGTFSPPDHRLHGTQDRCVRWRPSCPSTIAVTQTHQPHVDGHLLATGPMSSRSPELVRPVATLLPVDQPCDATQTACVDGHLLATGPEYARNPIPSRPVATLLPVDHAPNATQSLCVDGHLLATGPQEIRNPARPRPVAHLHQHSPGVLT